jgi:hypothetical protein
MEPVEEDDLMFDTELLLASIGGGIFGAAMGGLPTFIFTGLAVLAGVAASSFGPAEAAAIIDHVAFGPFFGPHVAFSAGAAAAAYAGSRGLLESGKDVTTPLIKLGDPTVLLVGAAFGVLGHIINSLWVSIELPTDTIALTVIISNALARILWGNGLTGKVPKGGSLLQTTETNVWIPQQKDLPILLILGAGLGLISGYACIMTGNSVTAFGIAAFSLLFSATLGAGPAWHQIAAPAGLAAVNSGSIVLGAVFGIIGALFAELGARIFYNYGNTHIDPPAIGIVIATTLALLLV